MRVLVFILLLSQFFIDSNAQEKYPAGCYMGFNELQNQTPSRQCKLLIEKRTGGERIAFGGNDISLFSEDKCLSKKEIRSEMLGYSDGNNLYLNGAKMKMQSAYVEILTSGRKFLGFRGTMLNDETMGAMLTGGMAGGFSSTGRYLYVLSLETGKLFYATVEFFEKILTDFPELKKQYSGESDKESDETMLKYLNLCNQSK